MKRISRSSRILLIISAALLAFAAALSIAARTAPGFAQWYSVTIYPVLQGTLGRLCGLFPFSVSEALVVILPLLLIYDIVRAARLTHRAAGESVQSTKPAIRVLIHVFTAICILIFMYYANCGVNYYREPFADPKAYASAEFTVDELYDFCDYAAGKILETEGAEYPDRKALATEAVEAMMSLASECDSPEWYDASELGGFYPQPKQMTWISSLFSAMGVSGIYSPFTIEANVNGQMTGLEKPFTSCHELSHLKGFMNEGEANFIGWLACINSEDKAFNRSGWLIAWIYAGNALYRADQDRYFEIREKRAFNFFWGLTPPFNFIWGVLQKHHFSLFINATSTPDNAAQRIENFIAELLLYDVRELTKVARMLRHWKAEIINSFDRVDGQRISNGPIESVNSRIKVIKQNGNGYRNFERFKLRVLYSLNDNSSINI